MGKHTLASAITLSEFLQFSALYTESTAFFSINFEQFCMDDTRFYLSVETSAFLLSSMVDILW